MPSNSSKPNHIPRVTFYKSYNFLGKDPVIDAVRTMVEDAGAKYAEIYQNGGVTPGTLHNWFDGQTRRPQFSSINAVARALGYDVRFVKNGGLDANIVPKIVTEDSKTHKQVVFQPRRLLSSDAKVPVAERRKLEKRRRTYFQGLTN